MKLVHRDNGALSQEGQPIVLAAIVSPFIDHILHVLLACPGKQMIRVAARRIIAGVADVPASRDFTLEMPVTQAMNVSPRFWQWATVNHDLTILGLWITDCCVADPTTAFQFPNTAEEFCDQMLAYRLASIVHLAVSALLKVSIPSMAVVVRLAPFSAASWIGAALDAARKRVLRLSHLYSNLHLSYADQIISQSDGMAITNRRFLAFRGSFSPTDLRPDR